MRKSAFQAIVVAVAVATVTFAGLAVSNAGKGAGSAGKVPIFPLTEKAGFKTLAKAIQVAGLQQTLTTGGPFTVFAPTDEAFAKLPAGTLESLLADPEALKNVLLYHVVSGEVLAADVVKLSSAMTLLGKPVTIDTSNGVKVNDANVIQTDVMAKNGVVHVIDAVLVP